MTGKDRQGMPLTSKHIKVLPNEMNEIDIRIVADGNRGIDAYKGDLHFEIIPPDGVLADINIDFSLKKCEYKWADAKGFWRCQASPHLHETRQRFGTKSDPKVT